MANITVNGTARQIDVEPETPLLWVLREELGLTGTKFGCGIAECGACTVHVDGVATRSCSTQVGSLAGKSVTTIEHLGQTPVGKALQKAWLNVDVMQCGYCQAGQLMSASALLAKNPNPSQQEVDSAMQGNICRCACYGRIRDAIQIAAKEGATHNA